MKDTYKNNLEKELRAAGASKVELDGLVNIANKLSDLKKVRTE
jgi:hypothetical protein